MGNQTEMLVAIHMHITPVQSIEVRAMVVAVQLQQPLSECTAIYAVYFVEHRPPPSAVIIHESCTDQQWNGFQDCARIQDQKVSVLATHQTL